MNYHNLKAIIDFLQPFSRIKRAARSADRVIALQLANGAERLDIAIDLSGSASAIYLARGHFSARDAAFDGQLARLSGAQILHSRASSANRIWRIDYERAGAYKSERGAVVIEFLGRKNNFILLDERGQITSALRYCSERGVLQGALYSEPEPAALRDKCQPPSDVRAFLAATAQQLRSRELASLKAVFSEQLGKKLATAQGKIAALPSAQQLQAEAQKHYERGELLKANLWRLDANERKFCLEGEEFALVCPPAVAMKKIFAAAKRASAKAAGIARERESLEGAAQQFRAQLAVVAAADDANLLREMFGKKQRRAAKKTTRKLPAGVQSFAIGTYRVLVGSSEAANAWLLENSRKGDFWFHLQAERGAHVICQTAKTRPDIDVLYQCASLAAAFSGKSDGVFAVDFTTRGKLHRDGAGAHVSYNDYDSIKVFLGSAAADKPRAR